VLQSITVIDADQREMKRAFEWKTAAARGIRGSGYLNNVWQRRKAVRTAERQRSAFAWRGISDP
jgi:hypothetical protein